MEQPKNDGLNYWYSQKHHEYFLELSEDSEQALCFVKLEDGSIREYTWEKREEGKPDSIFDDYIFLGKGNIDHIKTIRKGFF